MIINNNNLNNKKSSFKNKLFISIKGRKNSDRIIKTNQDLYLVLKTINNSLYFNVFKVFDGTGWKRYLVSIFVV